MLSKFKILFFLFLISQVGFGQIPILNSDANITNKVVYLDFDGQTVSGTLWDSGNTINAAASGMSAANIILIFKRVSEDYRPFDVNITTDVTRFNNAPVSSRMRVIITPTSAWYPSAGGVAYVGSFAWGGNPGTPCWVFENQLSYSAKNIAEAVAHEVGHTMTLRHQSTYIYPPATTCSKTAEYHPGLGSGIISWAPIMGVGYSRNVTVWFNGKSSTNCNLTQNDHGSGSPGITSPNYLSFRADDIGNNQANAKILNLNSLNLLDSGLVTEPGDVDAFRFTICNTRFVTMDVKPWALDTNQNSSGYQGANLDVRLFLYNSSNVQLAVDSPLTRLNARIGMNLSPGTYWFKVDGGGSANYSDYGSLGRYFVRVKATNPPLLTNTIITTPGICAGQPNPMSYASNGSATQWLWTVSGATTGTYTTQNPNIIFNSGLNTIVLSTSSGTISSCGTTATLMVTPGPQVVLSSSADQICSGTSATLNASGANTFTWQPGGLTGAMQIVNPQTTTTYTLTGSNGGSCNGLTLTTITVDSPFSINASVSSNSVCPGENTILTANGAANYVINPGGITSGGQAILSPIENTTYTITGQNPNSVCYGETTVNVYLKDCQDVGIRQLEKEKNGISIYPNPANRYLVVESITNDNTVEVVTATGQLIAKQKMSGKPMQVITESWTRGIYFIKVSSGEKLVYTEKVIVE